MRITNNMITSNTKSNINGNKVLVDGYNTQMTTQKKISKASEDPVIAIRSLRLSTTLTQVGQFVDNNIPDAAAWLDVSYTSLNNILGLITDARTQCINGTTDTLTTSDRQTLLQSLKSISAQIYTEGNADYAGRTVFTGYRTNSKLTFDQDEPETKYTISQNFTFEDMDEKSYYSGGVDVPADASTACNMDVTQTDYKRVRIAYDSVSGVSDFTYTGEDGDSVKYVFNYPGDIRAAESLVINENNTSTYVRPATVFKTEDEWQKSNYNGKNPGEKTVGDDEVIFIEQTGEFIFGKNLAKQMREEKVTMTANYEKTGFAAGELRPEFYYNCTDVTNESKPVVYTKADQAIDYTIANATKLTINTQASDVFDSSIQRDVNEMINLVQASLDANEKVTKIKGMMKESQYADAASQEKLQTWLDAAQKQADYADHNLQKTFEKLIGNFDDYLESTNTAITNVGSVQNRLKMVQSRVENQQDNIKSLKSQNEDRDISDIIIDYYAAYNAYQASLTAASKVGEQTLLNYL